MRYPGLKILFKIYTLKYRMKSYLIFLKNGEILEKKTNMSVFDISQFSNFTKFKMYQDYLVMYNEDETSELNLTVLSFTTDRYNSDIGLIKLENNFIKLKIKKRLICILAVMIFLYFTPNFFKYCSVLWSVRIKVS